MPTSLPWGGAIGSETHQDSGNPDMRQTGGNVRLASAASSPQSRTRRIATAIAVTLAAHGGYHDAAQAAADCAGEGRWIALGGGTNGQVRSVVTFDDGHGLATFAAGEFTTAGGLPCNRIARWDGSSWSPVGDGFNGPVHTLVLHDDGQGPSLYAGGGFTHSGQTPVGRVARWTGSQWESVGDGFDNVVHALTSVSSDGLAGLYAGGRFTHSGSQPAQAIARWDGLAWSQVGEGVQFGLPGFDSSGTAWVTDIVAHDFGAGPRVVIGGHFSRSGEVGAICVAQWDGLAIAAVGDLEVTECFLGGWYELLGAVSDLQVVEGAGGSMLMATMNMISECGPEGCGCMGFGSSVLSRAAQWTPNGWQTVFQRYECTSDCVCDFGYLSFNGVALHGHTRYLAVDIGHYWDFCDDGGQDGYQYNLYVSNGGPFQLAPSQPASADHIGVFDRITASPVVWVSGYYHGLRVLVCDLPCPGDLDGDGAVGGADIGVLLGEWGSSGKGASGDLTQDGEVNGADLAALLGAWGACP